MSVVSPRVREDSVHPRLQLRASGQPLNFTVRRRAVACLTATAPLTLPRVFATMSHALSDSRQALGYRDHCGRVRIREIARLRKRYSR